MITGQIEVKRLHVRLFRFFSDSTRINPTHSTSRVLEATQRDKSSKPNTKVVSNQALQILAKRKANIKAGQEAPKKPCWGTSMSSTRENDMVKALSTAPLRSGNSSKIAEIVLVPTFPKVEESVSPSDFPMLLEEWKQFLASPEPVKPNAKENHSGTGLGCVWKIQMMAHYLQNWGSLVMDV